MWLASGLVQACFGSQFGSHRESVAQTPWSEARIMTTRCTKRSGSRQHAKYRSDLQELASLRREQASRSHSDAIRSNAALDL